MNNKRKPTVYSSKRRKKAGFSSSHAVVPTIVTIAAAGLICVFGYSIAKPIVNNGEDAPANGEVSQSGEEETTTAPEDENLTAEDGTKTVTTAGTTNVVIVNGGVTTTTEAAGISGEETSGESGNNGTGTGSEGTSGETEGSSSEDESAAGTGSGSEGSSSSDTPTPVANVYRTVQCSVRLPQTSVTDAASLRAMLEDVKAKYPDAGAVVIPMKLSGGALNFASSAAGDAAGVVCQGGMTASEIASIVREAGLYAYASCSLLDDNLYPSVYSYRTSSYMIEKNGVLTGDQWLDNYADQGGKPWLDPASSVTTAYLEALVQELSDGGFSAILCSGFTYPNFRPADEQYLNPDVYAKNPDSMVELANTLSAAVPDTTDIVLDLSAYYAMNGWELVYQPDELDVSYALLNTSSSEAASAASWAQSNSGDLSVSLSYSDGSGSGHCVINY